MGEHFLERMTWPEVEARIAGGVDDMFRDITASGVVGDATRASKETGEKVLAALIPRIVQVAREVAGKDR